MDCLDLRAEVAVVMVGEVVPWLEEVVVDRPNILLNRKKMSSTGSMFMARGEECLEGLVGVGGGEFKGGEVDLGVVNNLLGDIPKDVIGESGGEVIEVVGGLIWLLVGGDRFY
ncbi:hypothetical protein Tco_1573914 [Tanacetum coccineum]